MHTEPCPLDCFSGRNCTQTKQTCAHTYTHTQTYKHSSSGLPVFSHTDSDQAHAIKHSLGSQGTTEALLSLSPLRSLTARRADKMTAVPPSPLCGTSSPSLLLLTHLPCSPQCRLVFTSLPRPPLLNYYIFPLAKSIIDVDSALTGTITIPVKTKVNQSASLTL